MSLRYFKLKKEPCIPQVVKFSRYKSHDEIWDYNVTKVHLPPLLVNFTGALIVPLQPQIILPYLSLPKYLPIHT